MDAVVDATPRVLVLESHLRTWPADMGYGLLDSINFYLGIHDIDPEVIVQGIRKEIDNGGKNVNRDA